MVREEYGVIGSLSVRKLILAVLEVSTIISKIRFLFFEIALLPLNSKCSSFSPLYLLTINSLLSLSFFFFYLSNLY